MKTIIFYGPVWFKNGRIGGSESGNKRSVEILTKLNFNIILLNKPYFGGGLVRALIYPFELLYAYLTFVWKSVVLKVDSFHLSAFYFYLIYIEWLYIATCKILRIRSIYEIRAGGAELAYKSKSSFYRYMFRLTVKQASVVMCQGKETVTFIKEITGIDALYYPNYVMDDVFLPYDLNDRDQSELVKMVYFGRIVPSKNIEFLLDICYHLKNNGINFNLEIIGDTNGNDAYLNSLKDIINKYDIVHQIDIQGAVKPDALFELLLTKHFFIFPTKESREGHSNSLTEAMSRGVVPIVSNMGFNRSVVGNDYLVVDTFDPAAYADKITTLWNTGKWRQTSEKCYQIIGDLFTESAVTGTLDEAHGGR